MPRWLHLNDRVSVGAFHSISLDLNTSLEAGDGFERLGSDALFDLSFSMRVRGWGGESLFSCNVCSESNRALLPSGSASIILREFKFEKFKSQLLKRVDSCKDSRAFECIAMLRTKFDWEYEGIISDPDLRSLVEL